MIRSSRVSRWVLFAQAMAAISLIAVQLILTIAVRRASDVRNFHRSALVSIG